MLNLKSIEIKHDFYQLFSGSIFLVLASRIKHKKYAMNTRNPIFIYTPVVFAMVFWSFSFIWYKQVFVYYDPITLIVFRLVIAVPLLFMLSIAFRKIQRINRKHIYLFLLLGFFEPFLYFTR